jgi:hypothetical protein
MIVKYLWQQGDVPPHVRHAGNGMVDSGTLPPFTGDPIPGPMAQLSLGEGTYQYSLWVTDDEGSISEPTTVEFTVKTPTNYMPDAACEMQYVRDNAECVDCVCTPTAMMGCLDNYAACYSNPDPTFVMLCKAIVDCGLTKGCSGAACYTPALCQAEIMAGASYMGGVDCMGDPAVNPCAAASALSTCSTMGACMTACN